jgi:hypothetical protein
MHIIDNPYYEFLYYLYCIEYRATHNKEAPNEVDAFRHIIKVDPSKDSFLLKAYAPTSAMWKSGVYQTLANTYEMNINFASRYNNIHITYPNAGDLSHMPNYEAKEYDPLLLNQRLKMVANRNYEFRRMRYFDTLFYGQGHELFSLMPACMVFDDNLEPYDWKPVIEKGIVIDYDSNGVKLSKLKYDEAKSASIITKLLPDTRTTPKGKFKIEKVVRTTTSLSHQRDIQYSIIKKISTSLSVNQLKFIGLSGGVSAIEFNKGNVLVPIQYNLGSLKLESYIKLFIAKYNELKYNTNRSDKLKYFEQAGLLNKITQYTPERFPDIKAKDFLTKLSALTNAADRYAFMQEYIVLIISTLLNLDDPIFRLFVVDIMTYILNIDKLYCISDGYVASTVNNSIDDEDAIGNNDQPEEVDEDDEGFIDQDNIDYEEDVDEEHDPQ